MPITIDVEELADIRELEAAWRDLEKRADAHFFNSWGWIGAWLANLDETPRLLVARHGETIAALACLSFRRERWRGLVTENVAHLNATGHPDQDIVTIEYNEPLIARTHAEAVRHALIRWLTSEQRMADRLVIQGAPTQWLDVFRDAGWSTRSFGDMPSYEVDLEGTRRSGQPYLARLSSNTRRQIRRSIKLYEERGPVRFERAATVEEGLAMFVAASALHLERWQARGEPGACSYPFFNAMHRTMIERSLPAGQVELVKVSAGDHLIGCLYNFIHDGRVLFYFGGLRFEDDNRLKPGLVTHALCIQDHIDRGHRVYDFLAGENRYKESLGQPGRPITTLIVERPHLLRRLEYGLRALKARIDRRRAA